MRVLPWLVSFIVLLCLGLESPGQELTYRRITMKEKLKKFYKTGGKAYHGKRVHILLSAEVFRRPHKVIVPKKGAILHCFPNKTVPVLISPKNLYLKRLKRKLAWQKDKIKIVSVFGKIVRPDWDLKGRYHLYIYKIKTYGGALKKIGRLHRASHTRRNGGRARESPFSHDFA
ncbi:MAG: hypothetical protein ACYTG7_19375 [Planctomycetota bacterium]|jgi:hypothetical protein